MLLLITWSRKTRISSILCNINIKDNLAKYFNTQVFQTVMVFRVGAEMDVIFVDFKKI